MAHSLSPVPNRRASSGSPKGWTCPALTILADDGIILNRPETNDRLSALRNRQSVTLPGQHHLHMDTPEPVAAAINGYLQTLPALGG